MNLYWVSLFLLPVCTNAQVLSVCDALDRLPELNGKEVQIRGAWLAGDTGEWLWAPDPCAHPVIKDGWVWKNTIAVELEESTNYRRWGAISAQWTSLKRGGPGPTLVIATLTGHLETREHFKVSRFSHLPEAYGYSAARLVVSQAEDLNAVPFTAQQLSRAEQEGISPWPVRVKKAHP